MPICQRRYSTRRCLMWPCRHLTGNPSLILTPLTSTYLNNPSNLQSGNYSALYSVSIMYWILSVFYVAVVYDTIMIIQYLGQVDNPWHLLRTLMCTECCRMVRRLHMSLVNLAPSRLYRTMWRVMVSNQNDLHDLAALCSGSRHSDLAAPNFSRMWVLNRLNASERY